MSSRSAIHRSSGSNASMAAPSISFMSSVSSRVGVLVAWMPSGRAVCIRSVSVS